MAKMGQEIFAIKAWLVAIANVLAKLLDPRLVSTKENTGEVERWLLRQAAFFIFGISLVLWAVGYMVFRFLLGR